MAERVFLVHGWSVKETTTYQALHLKLQEQGFDLHEIYLGRYVSLDDDVEIRDISRAMHRELVRKLGKPPWSGKFHIVTHSTGALVVKDWIVRDYVGAAAEGKPLKNLVFLAGPHFGSRLAHHGRSMLAHAAYFGATGDKVLTALELGSEFSWRINEAWLDTSHWKGKGIRPFNLIGDRVERSLFKSKIFPAGFEKGSDMVVRVPAGNLNFRRFVLDGTKSSRGAIRKVGEIQGVPFGALADYVHSGAENGVMNSITTEATPRSHQSLKLIVKCLEVSNRDDYDRMERSLASATRKTRKKRTAFAQLDLSFRDEMGQPIDDYRFELGEVRDGKDKPARIIADTHKNKIDGSRFTTFLNLSNFDSRTTYFMNFQADSGTELFSYQPEPFRVDIPGDRVKEFISADQTTQIEVRLGRVPNSKLFVFHHGDDPDLHVKWGREGNIKKTRIPPK